MDWLMSHLMSNPYSTVPVLLTATLLLHQVSRKLSLWTTKYHSKGCEKNKQNNLSTQLNHWSYEVHKIHPNIHLMKSTVKDKQKSQSKRLVLHYTFLTAKPKHVKKYSSLLTTLGIDVLVVKLQITQLVDPINGSHKVADEICTFLKANLKNYDKLFIFSCSVGAYLYCETVIKIRQSAPLLHECRQKLVGQIYECGVGVSHLPIGVGISLSDYRLLQKIITFLVKLYLRVKYASVTKYLEAAEEVMVNCPIPAPTYYMYSLRDPMTTEQNCEAIADVWRSKGVKATRAVFPDAGHVQNFQMYPKEYTSGIYTFLLSVKFAAEEDIEAIETIEKENS